MSNAPKNMDWMTYYNKKLQKIERQKEEEIAKEKEEERKEMDDGVLKMFHFSCNDYREVIVMARTFKEALEKSGVTDDDEPVIYYEGEKIEIWID